MMLTLAAESLLIATGIFPKKSPSDADIRRATTIHGRVEAAIKAFLKQEEPEPYEWEMPPEQGELHQQILAPLEFKDDPNDALPAELFGQWILLLGRARQYIADKWPIYDAEALVPTNYELDANELGDVWELVRAVDGVDGVISDLKSGTLSPPQVAAFAACYPDFYTLVAGGAGMTPDSPIPILHEQLAPLAANGWEPSAEQEDMIRVLQQIPDRAPIIVQLPPQQQPQQKRKTPLPSKAAQISRTRDEALEAKQQQEK
jgi:hypothetical protein